MKQLFLFLILSSAFLATSCNDDDMSGGSDGDDLFTAKIDGTDYRAEGTNAYATLFSVDNTIAIYGTGTPGTEAYPLLFVAFDENNTGDVGTYEMGLGKPVVGTYTNSAAEFTYGTASDQASGTLEITERTETRVKGTFSFTGVNLSDTSDRVEITDGSFDVTIQ